MAYNPRKYLSRSLLTYMLDSMEREFFNNFADNFVVATCFSTTEFSDDANNIFNSDVLMSTLTNGVESW